MLCFAAGEAAAKAVLIINGSSTTSETFTTSDVTSTLSAKLVAAGNTVTVADQPPASLVAYQEVWDVRFSNSTPLTAANQTLYTSFLQAGNQMFIMGENSGFMTRNNSIISFVQALGGGSLTFVSVNSNQSVNPPFNAPNAVTSFNYAAPGGVTNPGKGFFATSEAPCVECGARHGSAVAWGPGTLTAAPSAALVVVFDVNFMQSGGEGDAGAVAFLANLVGFVNNGGVTPPPPQTPGVKFDPVSMDFGAQAVGTTSAPRHAVLSNNGTAALTINSISSLGDFAYVTDCPMAPNALSQGASCGFDVTFSPLSIGSQSAGIGISDNTPAGQHGLGLLGFGLIIPQPAIGVTPPALGFADRTVGSTSPAQAITVTNSGQANLAISNVTISGSAFVRVSPTPASADCGAVVVPLASCQIAVVFAPSAIGAASSNLVISHNAQGGTTSVPLSGTGTPRPQAIIAFSADVGFGNQVINTSSAAKAVSISNIGTSVLTISAVGLTGANAGEFTLAGNCLVSLNPGASCSLTAVFTPGSLGAKSAQLAVTSNAQNNTPPVPTVLSGTGVPVPVPVVRLSATSLGFGNVIYGGAPAGQTVVLSNVGTAPLLIGSIAVSGNSDFSQANNCGTVLAAGAPCNINVIFTPHSLGARSGEMTITTNAAGSPHKVLLSGTGCRIFSPAAARFFLGGGC